MIRVVPFPLHSGQVSVWKDKSRFKVLSCGRRWGKTTYAVYEALEVAIRYGGWVWWVAPTYSLTKMGFNQILTICDQIPGVVIKRGESKIIFPNGGWIQARSGHDPSRLRGVSLDLVIVDEAAFCSQEVWTALRPTLTDRKGRALLISTPRGKNWFWTLFQKGIDPLKRNWFSLQLPTVSNPYIDPLEIEDAREDMLPVKFQQEYLAEFMSDFGKAFDLEVALKAGSLNAPEKDRKYYFGADWGRHVDYTVITVIDDLGRIVDYDRFTGISYERQRERIVNLYQHWKPKLIVAESNSFGESNIEALAGKGLPMRSFTTTNSSKAAIVDAFALSIERKQVTLLDDSYFLHELGAFELQQTPSGKWSYSAPQGVHDDIVISACLAHHAIQTHRIRLSVA